MKMVSSRSKIENKIYQEFNHIIYPSWRKKVIPLGVVSIGLLYLMYVVSFFDLHNIGKRWNTERASFFALDSYAHKVHVQSYWKNPVKLKVTLEGSRFETYDPYPEWVTGSKNENKRIDFGDDGYLVLLDNKVVMHWSGGVPITVTRPVNGKLGIQSVEDLPDYVRVTKNKINVRPSLYSRVQFYKTKIVIHRYFNGWEYFFFDFQSPLANHGFFDTLRFVFLDKRLDPKMSNLSLAWNEFLYNGLWLHKEVYVALFQTIFMAVLGTLIAAVFGLPMAFMAAYNVTPFESVRFVLRRLFDALRGIDMLIWSLIFIRAFGMGPFSGILAIGVTDTGTLGKLMSESIENIDKKEMEGVKSTGANSLQQNRFGILPQILPIFISQTLYYLESNTRGAVVVGAMGAGGIGLQFLGSLQTGKDWENVAYISLVVLVTVVVIDILSAKARRKLIG